MMLTGIEVETPLGAVLPLNLYDTSRGFAISDIDGLDPVKATVVSSSFAKVDGSQYQSSRRESRNMVLKIDLLSKIRPAQDSRQELYSYFMPKSWVTIRFLTDTNLVLEILGMVESFESPKFVKDTFANISIICFDPDFKDVVTTVVNGVTVSDDTDMIINYTGTVETGIVLKVYPDKIVDSFVLFHTDPSGVVRTLDYDGVIFPNQVLTINTISGQKKATVFSNGAEDSHLWEISPFSNWTELFRGENKIRIVTSYGPVPYTIEYVTRYGGL